MRILARLVLGLALSGGIVLGAARAALIDSESWYDAEHGWRLVSFGEWIEETNDGGATWKRIYRPRGARGVLRTGARAGVYYEDEGNCCTYWTNDGREFYVTQKISLAVTGEGRFLFVWNGRHLYRVSPWPFPHRCIRKQVSGRCVYRDTRRRTRLARFTTRLVGSVPNGAIYDAATLPGGVIAVSSTVGRVGDAYVIVARWVAPPPAAPRVFAQPLPAPPGVRLRTCGTFRRIYVSWPVMLIPVCSGDPAGPLVRAGYWQTANGGETWEYFSE